MTPVGISVEQEAIVDATACFGVVIEAVRAAVKAGKIVVGQCRTGQAASTVAGTVQLTRGALCRLIRTVGIWSRARRRMKALTSYSQAARATVGGRIGAGWNIRTAGQALTQVVAFFF